MDHTECSFHVTMFVSPLGDALSLGDLSSVYKAGCCRSSDLGKKQVSFRHKRTKATQQDLSNHILEHRSNGIGVTKKNAPPLLFKSVYTIIFFQWLSSELRKQTNMMTDEQKKCRSQERDI